MLDSSYPLVSEHLLLFKVIVTRDWSKLLFGSRPATHIALKVALHFFLTLNMKLGCKSQVIRNIGGAGREDDVLLGRESRAVF